KKGFAKLESGWNEVRKVIANANKDGEFTTFQSYEMHSSQFGDHHILSPDDNLELAKSTTPTEIIEKLEQRAIAIPHHVAYSPGYRGISWKDFNNSISPVIEVYSKHGCGVSDDSGGEYLHTMGPRDGGKTAYEGLKQGKQFGFVASTDHHAGYPGSYGDGITAVLSEELTREAIWSAITKRQTYALTGDRIRCDFTIDGQPMGSEIPRNAAHAIKLKVNAAGAIEKAVIYKNLKPIKAIHIEDILVGKKGPGKYKIRIETGWGRKTSAFQWVNSVKVNAGEIITADPCFRGQSVLAPNEREKFSKDVNLLGNRITSLSKYEVSWVCKTFRNPTTRHSATCAIVMEIKGSPKTKLEIKLNDKTVLVSIEELQEHGISGHLQIYNSEAYLIHKAVHESAYCLDIECTEASESGDYFHAEIHQVNEQSAWISPVYIK
ncbi:MAG: DUF3604 domain-containing protein, partial [Holophagae bacterium]|nr:DUF3604 domain-containing protein [Holophagae bacterium]